MLDQEWVELMKEAMELGISKDEVMNFLLNPCLKIHTQISSEFKIG